MSSRTTPPSGRQPAGSSDSSGPARPPRSLIAGSSSARRSTCARLLRKRPRRQGRRGLLRSASQASSLEVTVVGSINLDLVATVDRLPRPGETRSGATLDRIPGGKGANQAVAAARLGADVRLVGAVGRDSSAAEALAELRDAGVELDVRKVAAPTGIALIVVAADGE